MIVRLLDMFFNRRDHNEHVEMLREAVDIMEGQRQMLKNAAAQIADWQDRARTSHTAVRDLAIAWRAHLDSPDIDIRDDLDELIFELRNSVAALEEHLPR